MQELIAISFSIGAIIPTFLLLFVIGYWLIVILGAIDLDAIDFDVDVDADVDVDVDVDTDVDVDADHDVHHDATADITWLSQVLTFFNLGKIPFMVWLTFVAIPLWFGTIVMHEIFGSLSAIVSLVLFIPMLIASLFISKFLTYPFVKLFHKLNKEEEDLNVIGKVCILELPVTSDKTGQAAVNIEGTQHLVYVRTRKGIELNKGETALIIEHDKNESHYLIEPYENL